MHLPALTQLIRNFCEHFIILILCYSLVTNVIQFIQITKITVLNVWESFLTAYQTLQFMMNSMYGQLSIMTVKRQYSMGTNSGVERICEEIYN